ncbi:MAG: hypothetical protein AAF670_09450 [Planctomycetota bacterium]
MTQDPTPPQSSVWSDTRSPTAASQTLTGTVEPPEAILFRVRCPDAPVRRLRLAGARYTIGSGVGCSIRLEDASLRPLHAVLIRDQHRVLVRAYSVPFLINQVRTTEGFLDAGDVLRLGAYEFELLDFDGISKTSQATQTDDYDATDMAPLQQRSITSALVHPGATDENHWKDSLHQDAVLWRKQRDELETLRRYCDEQSQHLNERADELEQQQAKLKAREQALKTQESAAVEVHAEFQKRHDALTVEKAVVDGKREALQADLDKLRRRQADFEGRDQTQRERISQLIREKEALRRHEESSRQRLETAQGRLAESQQQAEAASAAVAQMRDKFNGLNEQLLELSQQQDALQQLEIQRNRRHVDETTALSRQLELISEERDRAFTQRDEAIHDLELANLAKDELTDEIKSEVSQREAAMKQRDEILSERDAAIDAKAQSNARYEDLLASETELKDQVEQLQVEIAAAREEAGSLRGDCQQARQTITELESLVREHQDRQDSNQDSWSVEIEQLRKNVESLSMDLAGAEKQLAQLRDENAALTQKFEAVSAQCDALQTEADESQRQRDAALRQVDQTRELFNQSNREHDETLGQIERLEQKTRDIIQPEPTKLGLVQVHEPAEDERLRAEVEVAEVEPAPIVVEPGPEPVWTKEPADELDDPSQTTASIEEMTESDDDEVWPTYSSIDPAAESEPSSSPLVSLDESDQETAYYTETDPIDDHSVSPQSHLELADEIDDPEVETVTAIESLDDHALPSLATDAIYNPDLPFSEQPSAHSDAHPLQNVVHTESDPATIGDVAADERSTGIGDPVAHNEGDELGLELPASPLVEPDIPSWPDQEPVENSAEPDSDGESEPVPIDSPSTTLDWSEAPQDLSASAEPEMPSWPTGPAVASDQSTYESIDADQAPAQPIITGSEALAHDGQPVVEQTSNGSTSDEGSLAQQLIRDLAHDTDLTADAPTHSDEIPALDDDSIAESSSLGAHTQVWDGGTDIEDDSTFEQTVQHDFSEDSATAAHTADWGDHTPEFESNDVGNPINHEPADSVLEMVAASESAMADETRESSPSNPHDLESSSSSTTFAADSDDESGNEDDSIEAYMNRLLQRVQGSDSSESSSPSVTTTVSQPVSVTPEPKTEPPESDQGVMASEPPMPAPEPLDPNAPLVPRSQAPEKNSNLSAMRELANETARGAITRSVKSQTKETTVQAAVKFACAAVAALCVIAAKAMIAGVVGNIAAIAAIVVAAIFIKEGWDLMNVARQRHSGKEPNATVEVVE